MGTDIEGNPAYFEHIGNPIDPTKKRVIGGEEIEGFLSWKGLTLNPAGGDILLGVPERADTRTYFNSAVVLGGAPDRVYRKSHLVPFGEYVPWRDQLSFLPELRQVPYDFQAGDRTKVLRAGGQFAFSTELCDGGSYRLQETARYAQSPAYVDDLARRHGLAVRRMQGWEVRTGVEGRLYLLAREPGGGTAVSPS